MTDTIVRVEEEWLLRAGNQVIKQDVIIAVLPDRLRRSCSRFGRTKEVYISLDHFQLL